MAKNSNIEWTNHSYNPWRGCLKISPGCKQCYMYREQERYGRNPRVVTRSKTTFYDPFKWKEPALVFTCSWSDFFIQEADDWRHEVWNIIKQTPHLTYQILTKRPENIVDRLPADWGDGWPNVWLGVSVENQDYIWRVDELDNIPAIVHFVSYEPALGPLNIEPELYFGKVDWLISGGESGNNPRPANLNWFRQIRDACQRFNIPFFHKQHGGNRKINGSWGGRLLDGQEWSEFPKAHQYPFKD